jgi:omega-amidase
MRVSCIQLDMKFCDVEYNYSHAAELIKRTVKDEKPDVILLPETWTTGYYPKEKLASYSDNNGERIKSCFSKLSKELDVNIIAGSIANNKDGKIYNTAYVFDRSGNCVAEYDKTHLFTPMDEDKFFEFGNHLTTFTLDGVKCGIVICYDIRFPELIRSLALKGIEMLFMVSQWPEKRVPHIQVLTQARAIENQMFVACCNSCGKADGTVFGGSSQIVDPWGVVLERADGKEQVITADCDFSIIKDIRSSINVFNDRKTKLYEI